MMPARLHLFCRLLGHRSTWVGTARISALLLTIAYTLISLISPLTAKAPAVDSESDSSCEAALVEEGGDSFELLQTSTSFLPPVVLLFSILRRQSHSAIRFFVQSQKSLGRVAHSWTTRSGDSLYLGVFSTLPSGRSPPRFA